MSQTPSKSILRRWAPLVAVILGAVAGAVFLRDYLSFDTLRDNRDALLAYRDASPVLTPALFVLAYVVIVSFSLPGATVATLAGGFLFGLFPGVRGGDIVGEHDVMFAADGERLILRHVASDRAVFARGALKAALWAQGRAPGEYDMMAVLGL
mgnify:CR=1 FL=1